MSLEEEKSAERAQPNPLYPHAVGARVFTLCWVLSLATQYIVLF